MDRNFQSEEIIILITAGVFIMLLLTFVLIAFFVLSQQKLNNERQKAHEQQLQHSEQLLFSTLQTQENERSRIAKDLHDDVGSKLNVLNLNLYRLQKQTTSLPELIRRYAISSRSSIRPLIPPGAFHTICCRLPSKVLAFPRPSPNFAPSTAKAASWTLNMKSGRPGDALG